MNKLPSERAEDSQDERKKWEMGKKKKKLCKVLNVKTISFDVMSIG